jgi:hypothetical protein
MALSAVGYSEQGEKGNTRQIAMADAKQLAGLIGPSMVAISVTEAINIDVFANQLAPVVYLNGVILFVAGLAVVRAHNIWAWRWPIVTTLTGWVALISGLWRMVMPEGTQMGESFFTYMVLVIIGAFGTILTVKAYSSD